MSYDSPFTVRNTSLPRFISNIGLEELVDFQLKLQRCEEQQGEFLDYLFVFGFFFIILEYNRLPYPYIFKSNEDIPVIFGDLLASGTYVCDTYKFRFRTV